MRLTLELHQPGHCPACGSSWIHRSRRKSVLETVLHHTLLLSPYRCEECDERHLRFRSAQNVNRPTAQTPRHAA